MQGTTVLSWGDAAHLEAVATPEVASKKNSALGLKQP